jgi:hypothetical protein
MFKIGYARMPILAALILSFLITGVSFAQNIGTAVPSINPTNLTLNQGATGTVSFKIILINGSAGNTCLFIPNNNYLQSLNISASIYPDSGTPPFNGTLTIIAGKNTPPGTNYSVGLSPGCSDNLNGHPRGTVSLTVLGAPVTTTIATTTVSSNSTSNTPTTTVSKQPTPPTTVAYTTSPTSTAGSPNNTYLMIAAIAILVIIIILIIVIWLTKK